VPTLTELLQHLAAPPAIEVPDTELLCRFTNRDDPRAFEAILRRHGRMVFGVCVRVLGRTADAEDAFQATFLVFLRQARRLAQPERLVAASHTRASPVRLSSSSFGGLRAASAYGVLATLMCRRRTAWLGPHPNP
jgi:hypothetical protein